MAMKVDYDQALQAYYSLDKIKQIPSLHPFYVCADAKRDESIEPVFFTLKESDKIFYYGFHLGRIPGTEYFDIQSPYGYGGPVASCHDRTFLSEALSHFSWWCIENNVLAEFVRFHPLLENWQYFDGNVIDDRQTVWIDLTVDDLMSSYTTRVRTAIRKAQKSGLRVEWVKSSESLSIFYELYNSAMKEIAADNSYIFPLEYHEALLGWNNSRLAVCRLEGTIVAAALFVVGPSLVEYHLSSSLPQGKKLGATNLMLHEAALHAKQMGYTRMHLGGGTDKQPDNSLLFFKAGFSNHKAVFRIGKKIYQPKIYDQMKMAWQRVRGIESNRVLFYRF
ncbi:MAG: GNAT family N-acetyltransferase [Syntrophales bacterium LBB04]|nr:GNAT family N-acetyltransferase [Syntrophales bacterium LBB04]